MDDLEKYIEKRKKSNPDFEKDFESGYNDFKIGVLLKQARIEVGLTQEEIANKLHTKKSAISRIENHAEDINFDEQTTDYLKKYGFDPDQISNIMDQFFGGEDEMEDKEIINLNISFDPSVLKKLVDMMVVL